MKWTFLCPGLAALLLGSNSSCFAQNAHHDFLPPILSAPANWYLGFAAGAQFPQWNNPMKVNNSSGFPAPYNNDLYTTKNENGAVLALALGRRWERNSFWLPSYSLGVFWQYLFRTDLGNTITQYSLPQFTNYAYSWQLTSNLLLASAKLNLFQYGKFSPYFNIGVGSSFNRTSDYKEIAFAGISPRVNPGFSKFSTSEFSYNLGVGVDMQITPKFIVSAGYIYQDLGQISSGSGQSSWSNTSLNPGSFHSNELLVSFTYLFGQQEVYK